MESPPNKVESQELLNGNHFDFVDLQRWTANATEWAVILAPLMLYLLILGLGVNWRRRPVPVRGQWNAVGMIFALSGFFLVGPPSWIANYFQLWGVKWYWAAYSAYVAVLGLISLTFIYRQRKVLVIYNIEPPLFAEVLEEVLVEQAIPHTTTPGRVAFAEGQTVLDIETFTLLSNVRLRWRGKRQPLQASIEQSLRGKLKEVTTSFNLSTGLLTLVALLLFVFIYFAVVFFVALNP